MSITLITSGAYSLPGSDSPDDLFTPISGSATPVTFVVYVDLHNLISGDTVDLQMLIGIDQVGSIGSWAVDDQTVTHPAVPPVVELGPFVSQDGSLEVTIEQTAGTGTGEMHYAIYQL